MHVILTKVPTFTSPAHTSYAPLRTSVVEGSALSMPEVGKPFGVMADAFVEGAIARLVITSYVTGVYDLEGEEGIGFFTETGSHYKVQVVS